MKRYCTTHGIVPTNHRCKGRWRNQQNRWAWTEQRKRILARDGYRCTICGSQRNLEVHHLTPGTNIYVDDSQLRTVCRTHNPRGG